jgi:hypothetical protein
MGQACSRIHSWPWRNIRWLAANYLTDHRRLVVPVPHSPPRSKPADESLPLRQTGRRLEIGEVHLNDPSSAAHNWATPVVDDGTKALAARSGIGMYPVGSTPFFRTSTQCLSGGRDRPVSRASAWLEGRLAWAVRGILRRRRSRSSLGLGSAPRSYQYRHRTEHHEQLGPRW